MKVTEDQTRALDSIVIEVTEFTKHCVEQEAVLNQLMKDNLVFSVLLKCLCDEVDAKKDDHTVESLYTAALNMIMIRAKERERR